MNFPIDNPILRFIYWLLNSPTIGGIVTVLIIAGLLTTFAFTLWWIANGAKADEPESYTFPTSSLIEH